MKYRVCEHSVTIAGLQNLATYSELDFYKYPLRGQKTYCYKKSVGYRNNNGCNYKRHIDTKLKTLNAKQFQFIVNKFMQEYEYSAPNPFVVHMILGLTPENKAIRGCGGYASFRIVNHQCFLEMIEISGLSKAGNMGCTTIRSLSFHEMLVSAKRLLKQNFDIDFDVDKV